MIILYTIYVIKYSYYITTNIIRKYNPNMSNRQHYRTEESYK